MTRCGERLILPGSPDHADGVLRPALALQDAAILTSVSDPECEEPEAVLILFPRFQHVAHPHIISMARHVVEPRRLHTIPISSRPPHGPLASKIFFPLLLLFGLFGIASTTILAAPLLLLPRGWGVGTMANVVAYTKDGFGRLCTYYLDPHGWLCAVRQA